MKMRTSFVSMRIELTAPVSRTILLASELEAEFVLALSYFVQRVRRLLMPENIR
jgi:hypothetical protein